MASATSSIGTSTHYELFTAAASDVSMVHDRGNRGDLVPRSLMFCDAGTFVLERLDGTNVSIPIAAADTVLRISARAIDSTTTNGLRVLAMY